MSPRGHSVQLFPMFFQVCLWSWRLICIVFIALWVYGLATFKSTLNAPANVQLFAGIEILKNTFGLAVGWGVTMTQSISVIYLSFLPIYSFVMIVQGIQWYNFEMPITYFESLKPSNFFSFPFLQRLFLVDIILLMVFAWLFLCFLLMIRFDVPSGIAKGFSDVWLVISGYESTEPIQPVQFTPVAMHLLFTPHPMPGSQEMCSICLSEQDEKSVKSVFCSHAFHSDCIKEWLEHVYVEDRSCPLCKQSWHKKNDDPELGIIQSTN
ncbi:hypothetical protein EDD86DRAFT_13333 [Gorgonomyces haynaldii]|nr:hypothetical protein EDD86DRAFT_13333 [Gorgonomyces haynaldii]